MIKAIGVGSTEGLSQHFIRPLAGAMEFLSNSYLEDLTKSDATPFPGTENKGIFKKAAEGLNNFADNLDARAKEESQGLPGNLLLLSI